MICKIFLNEDEERDIKTMVKSLMKSNAQETEFQETGGLGIMVETNNKELMSFSIYRTIGYFSEKK